MHQKHRTLNRFILLLVGLAVGTLPLAGCGNGGGSSNQAPTLEVPAAQVVTEGTAVNFTVTGADPNANDSLTYSVSGISYNFV